jgi:putative peptidoglycan lipid II flippase
MLLSVIFNIIAKGILFLLTIFIARLFGSNIKTDIYFFVYGTMVLLSGFISAVDTSVLIPQSMRLRENEGTAAATVFLNYFLRIYILVGVVFVAILFFFGVQLFGLISKFSAADIELYKNYFLAGSLYFFFMVLTNYINAILTSLKFFTVPMIISGINSCIVIACIFFLHGQYDVLSVFIGGIAAYSINLIILTIVLHKIAGWNFFSKGRPVFKKTGSHIIYAGLGQLATFASSFLPLFLLSGFGQGVISMMNYGKNIADIPNTLVTAQLSNVSGIELNEQAARKDLAGMNASFTYMSKWLLYILVPAGFYLFVFAEPVVQFFYRSRNFNSEAIAGSAQFLRLLAVTVFSIGINSIVSRVFIAMQAIKQAFVYQLIINGCLVALILVFTNYYGANGYPYAVILMNLVNFLLMYFICRRLFSTINYGAILPYAVLIIAINAAIAAGLYYSILPLQVAILVKLLSGFIIYLLILLLLNKKFQFTGASVN